MNTVKAIKMPSRKKADDESFSDRKKMSLVNISGKGLCYVQKNGSLLNAGDLSMVPIGRARDTSLGLKGFVWLLKFYPSAEKVLAFVDKVAQKNPDTFERAVDSQTEHDCNFRIKGTEVTFFLHKNVFLVLKVKL